MFQILALYLDFDGQRTSMTFKSSFGALEDTGGDWLGFDILILIWIWSLLLDTIMIQILALYLGLKVQRTSVSFKSSFGALEDTGGSWLDLGILILISTRSLFFDLPIIWIPALYLDFEGAKNIYII